MSSFDSFLQQNWKIFLTMKEMVEEMYKDFELRKQINELEESNSALREENIKLKRLLEATKDRDVLKEPLKDYFY